MLDSSELTYGLLTATFPLAWPIPFTTLDLLPSLPSAYLPSLPLTYLPPSPACFPAPAPPPPARLPQVQNEIQVLQLAGFHPNLVQFHGW